MERDTIYFLVTVVLILGSVGGLAYYQNMTILDLRAQILQADANLNSEIQQNRALLENEIFVLDQKVDLRTHQLEQFDEEFNKRLVETNKEIIDTRKEARLGISDLAQKSEELQTDILSLNVQSADFSIIVNKIIDGVVAVRTDKSIGSGAVVDPRGFIVTNAHVMKDASSAAVVTYDKRVHPVALVAKDDDADLALLKIGTGGESFYRLKFASDRILRVGQKVAALGSPGGLDFSVTEGIVSALTRTNSKGVEFLQHDVSINPGNSGGPLVNIEGYIVGINTMKKEDFEGIGFAIKADQVEDFVDDSIRAWEQTQSN